MLVFDSETPLSPPRPIFHTTKKCTFLKEKSNVVDSRVYYNKIQIGIVEQIFNIILDAQFNFSFSVDEENKEENFHYDILKRLQNGDIRVCMARYSAAAYFFRL